MLGKLRRRPKRSFTLTAPRRVDVGDGLRLAAEQAPNARIVAVDTKRWMLINQRVEVELDGSDDAIAEFRRALRNWAERLTGSLPENTGHPW
jgi:hypothetical protein